MSRVNSRGDSAEAGALQVDETIWPTGPGGGRCTTCGGRGAIGISSTIETGRRRKSSDQAGGLTRPGHCEEVQEDPSRAGLGRVGRARTLSD